MYTRTYPVYNVHILYDTCQQHVHSSHVGLKEKAVVVTSRHEEAAAPVETAEPEGTTHSLTGRQ